MIQNIQILRFFAALGVVLFHTRVPMVVPIEYQPTLPDALQGLVQLGFAGVDLFFVISGAVIAQSTRALPPTHSSSWRFIAVRLARVYLGWWPFFIAYLFALPLWGWPLEGKRFASSFFLLPSTEVLQYTIPILWTLAMEVYFYLVVGALLMLPRVRLRRAMLVWGALALSVTLNSVATGRYADGDYRELNTFVMYFASPFVLEFIGGFLLSDLVASRPGLAWQPWGVGALVLLAIATALQLSGKLGPNGLAEFAHAPLRVLLFGGAACGLVMCAVLLPQQRGPVGGALASLGDASYALYLCHILVLVSAYLAIAGLGLPVAVRPGLYVLAVAAACAFALLHYRWIERPVYTASRRCIEKALA